MEYLFMNRKEREQVKLGILTQTTAAARLGFSDRWGQSERR